MAKWEYLVVYIQGVDVPDAQREVNVYADADRYTEKLNNYGDAGWELVSLDWEENGAKAAFKRLASG